MAVREYVVQIRYVTDNPKEFDTVTKVIVGKAREIAAMLRVAAGPGQPAPAIHVYSDNFHENVKTDELNMHNKNAEEPTDV